jgi:hypothetical protein
MLLPPPDRHTASKLFEAQDGQLRAGAEAPMRLSLWSNYSACQVFLGQLPAGTALEPVEVNVEGHDLEEVRAQIKTAEAELAALRALPTPSADIERRLRDYVHSMARPQISGIGKGEKLRVFWPGCGWDSSGPRDDRADILPMMALLHGDAMVAALMREIERNDPVPIKERATRIAALTDEIEQLAYVEEALVAAAIASGEDVQRSPGAPPHAVLGVRVVEGRRVTSRAA